MSTAPGSYDSSGITITVDPNALLQLSTVTVPSLAEGMANSIKHISDTLAALKVSWVGNSSATAQDFQDRWVAAMTHLFGTKDAPATGVLNRLMIGVGQAAYNYGYAEDGVAQMWHKIALALGGSETSNTNEQPGSSPHNEPIVET